MQRGGEQQRFVTASATQAVHVRGGARGCGALNKLLDADGWETLAAPKHHQLMCGNCVPKRVIEGAMRSPSFGEYLGVASLSAQSTPTRLGAYQSRESDGVVWRLQKENEALQRKVADLKRLVREALQKKEVRPTETVFVSDDDASEAGDSQYTLDDHDDHDPADFDDMSTSSGGACAFAPPRRPPSRIVQIGSGFTPHSSGRVAHVSGPPQWQPPVVSASQKQQPLKFVPSAVRPAAKTLVADVAPSQRQYLQLPHAGAKLHTQRTCPALGRSSTADVKIVLRDVETVQKGEVCQRCFDAPVRAAPAPADNINEYAL